MYHVVKTYAVGSSYRGLRGLLQGVQSQGKRFRRLSQLLPKGTGRRQALIQGARQVPSHMASMPMILRVRQAMGG